MTNHPNRNRQRSLETLPPVDTVRWTMRRKARVVYAVKNGILQRDEACKRYSISPAELSSWEWMVEKYGVSGLRTTRIQQYERAAQ